MTRNSRDKLNSIYGIFIIAVAAVLGAIAGSWMLFILVAAGLFTVFAQPLAITSAISSSRRSGKSLRRTRLACSR